MDQLIEAFGIDLRLIIVQIINFVILLGLLSYFLYKPVLKLLQDREDTIKRGLVDAEAAATAKASAEEEKREVLKAAEQEASDIAARARQHAESKSSELIKDAEHKAENLLQDARLKSVEIQNKVRKESEQEIAKLAILAAEKVLRERTNT